MAAGAVHRRLLALAFIVLAAGCTDDEVPPTVVAAQYSGLFRIDSRAELPAIGESEVSWNFSIPTGVTSFQVLVDAPGNRLVLDRLEGPRGRSLPRVAVDESSGFQPSPLTLGYPLSPEDTLVPGGYRVVVLLQQPAAGDVAFTLITKQDPDPAAGVLKLNVIYSGSIVTARNSREAITAAIDDCGEIFMGAGIKLAIEEHELPEAPSIMPDPYAGDPLYEELAKAAGPGVNIYMAADAPGSFPSLQYATAGSSPGPILATERSGIVVRIADAAGSDGLFNADDDELRPSDDFPPSLNEGDEIQLLADNICHSLFRYLGLPYVVEFSDSTVVAEDPFDTPKCASRPGCAREKKVRENIMYPEVVIGRDGRGRFSFYPRHRVEPQQAEAANLYVGVGRALAE